ncbi:MAG: hypothetical protein IJF32_08380 [Oscillospiraceae bacterium]|nr:hypothetical protein [Oscillospiraceae bacterium]
MIKIFCDKKEKKLRNFWNHIVFHPTDAIEDDWGRRILDKCAEDKAVKTVRIYSMMENIFSLDENGEITADYELNDYRIDYLLSKGFEPHIVYAFIPGWLCERTDITNKAQKGKTRYKGKMLYNSRVTDYSKWEEICRQYTRHIIDKYGEETVSGWRVHCYNEPDHKGFFYNDAPDMYARLSEYCKLYDAFEAGVTSVSGKIQIGGPALAQSGYNLEFLELFLNHVRENNKKLDFIAFHSYGASVGKLNDGISHLRVRGSFYNAFTIAKITKLCGFGNLPLVWDEWGALSEGYLNIEDCPKAIFRENEVYSAYFVKLLTELDEIDAPFEKMMICLSGQHEMKADFSGLRNFFTLNFFPKPIYNAFVLAGKLGEEKLSFYARRTHEHVSVMPTVHEDGHISVLFAYADAELRNELPEIEVPLRFLGIDRAYRVEKYIIDKKHANAIEKYRELGCPDNPTDEQKKEIYDFATLKAESAGEISPENSNYEFMMENNSVVLLELYPM